MAGSASDYLEKKLLDAVLSQVALPAIGTVYVALFTDANTATQRDAGTVTEVPTGTWTNYARIAVTNNATQWPAASGVTATKQNANPVSFGTVSSTGTVTVTAFGIYDASTAGNLLFWGDLAASKVINNGDTVSFAANQVSITCD